MSGFGIWARLDGVFPAVSDSCENEDFGVGLDFLVKQTPMNLRRRVPWKETPETGLWLRHFDFGLILVDKETFFMCFVLIISTSV